MTIYIITIIFVFFAWYFWKKRGISITSIMWIWYAIMYISSILLVTFYDWKVSPNFEAYVYMAGVLFIFFIPISTINDSIVDTLILPSEKYLRVTIVLSTIGSLFATLFYIPSAIKALSVGISEIDYVRDMIIATGENPFIQRSIFNTIASIFSTFYMLQMVFFFITIIKEQKLSMRSFLILVSSTSYIFLVLSFMGRDCFVFWGLSFLFLYVFFSKFIDDIVKRKIRRIFTIMMSGAFFVFILITIGRFMYYSSDSDFLYPFIDYMGQGPMNFIDIFDIGIIPNGGSGIFSLLFGDVDVGTYNHNQIIYFRNNISTNVFRTIVGSLYTNFGKFGTIIFAIITAIYVQLNVPKNKKNWDFSFIIIYVLYIMIIYQGVFYYKLYDNASNIYIILSFLMAIVYKRLPKQIIYLQK